MMRHQTAQSAPPRQLDSRWSWYTLGLLTFAYALAYVDRQVLNLLVDPIKSSLAIDDTRFSLVQGTAFVSAYLVATPIFGRLADVSKRRNILIFGVMVWSCCTAICGLAKTYEGLFLARLGLGISEACIAPVALSLIGDYFSPSRMARALSIFYIGGALGSGMSLLAGGTVIAFASDLRLMFASMTGLETWRIAFIVIGLPGILFGLLLLTLREPKRQYSLEEKMIDEPLPIRKMLYILWERRAFYGRIYLTMGMLATVLLGVPSWYPALMMRKFGLSSVDTGYQLGLIAVSFGTVGTLIGPYLARQVEKMGYADSQLRFAACAAVMVFISCLLIPVATSSRGALAIAAMIYFSSSLPLGLTGAVTQNVTPARMRGVVASLYTFFSQIIGYMIGPTLIALCTDHVFGDPTMVGYSMQMVMASAGFMAAVFLFSALPHYRALATLHVSKLKPVLSR